MQLEDFLEIGDSYLEQRQLLTTVWDSIKAYLRDHKGIVLASQEEGKWVSNNSGYPNSNGYFSPRDKTIFVRNRGLLLEEVRTLIHETAHSILHDNGRGYDPVEELEADLTSCLVMAYLGFDVKLATYDYISFHFKYTKLSVDQSNWDKAKRASELIIHGARLKTCKEQFANVV